MPKSSPIRLEDLERIVAERGQADPSASYTAKLMQAGLSRAAQKLGEEAVETVLAAVSGNRSALRSEAADLLYHLMVVLAAAKLPLDEVYEELGRRTAQSGLEEKASRAGRG
ncbi:MAG: phosphoribosyl-ATP diphosphatase [Pseudomonadota bacterium]